VAASFVEVPPTDHEGADVMLYFITFLRTYVDSLKTTDRDQGAALVEYALLVSLIAIIVIPALVLVGPAIAAIFTEIVGSL
jgi:pilus assembly protein Flp/PilA